MSLLDKVLTVVAIIAVVGLPIYLHVTVQTGLVFNVVWFALFGGAILSLVITQLVQVRKRGE